jgi:hypothetical protein
VSRSLHERYEYAPRDLTFHLPGRHWHKSSMGFQSGNDLQNIKSFGLESRSVQTEIGLPLQEVQGQPRTEDLGMAVAERLVCLRFAVDRGERQCMPGDQTGRVSVKG